MRRLLDFSFMCDKKILINGGLDEVKKRMA